MIQLLGLSTIKPEKKRERKIEKVISITRRIDENDEDPQPRRPPKNSHHAPSTPKNRMPSTFKKEYDNDNAAARTGPRVSPGT
jgi:hypothetical protein